MRPLELGRRKGVVVRHRSLVALLLLAGISGSLVMPLQAVANDVSPEPVDEPIVTINQPSDVLSQVSPDVEASSTADDMQVVGVGDDTTAETAQEMEAAIAENAPEMTSSMSTADSAETLAPETGGTTFRSMSAMNLRSSDALSCEDNTMYGLTASGNMRRLSIDPNTGQVGATSADVFSFNIDAIAEARTSFNGLAIGNNGQLAYALTRRPPLPAGSNIAPERALQLYMWTSSTNRVERLWGAFDIGNYGSKIPNAYQIVGGATNPVKASPYYFGGFYAEAGKEYFELFRVDTVNLKRIGIVEIGPVKYGADGKRQGLNGDIAMNAHGDLFILWNNGKGGDQGVVPVAAADLNAANGNAVIPSGESRTERTEDPTTDIYNGIALDSRGRVYVQNTSSATNRSVIKALDPFTYEPIARSSIIDEYVAAPGGLYKSGDLASCASPVTIEVKKNIVGRALPSDHFQYGISLGNKKLATATSGNITGIQPQVAGPQIVLSGTTYTIWEAANDSNTNINEYKSTLTCVVQDGTNTPVETIRQTPTRHTLTVPYVRPGTAITCTFTNEPALGSLRWNKVESGTNTLLPGSQWRLKDQSNPSAVYSVSDNGTNDSDPAVGKIFVEGKIPPGTYTLEEIQAPVGYVAAPEKTGIVVTRSSYHNPINLGSLPNRKIKASVTWRKVGEANDALAGSIWTFTPTNPSGPALTIMDCTQAPCASTGYDTDARPGHFTLVDVIFGRYTLSEHTAPTGYLRDTAIRDVNVMTDGQTIALGNIRNLKAEGAVTWRKTDNQTPANLLGGSAWTITPTQPTGTAITVEDCIAAPCNAALRDTDPTKGVIHVRALPFGRYTLVEARPPIGYSLSSETKTFVIDSRDITVNVGNIVNHPRQGVSIPLTGGMGADYFLVAGAGITALALLVGHCGRRRITS
ncbi:MSCRAMM family protein [Schaalia suimastitidis]|uniref:MSCRAMM family protein n=1 Tax=Schaalia suimastitidis TaxID=121163 RepID=UPI0003F6E14F|nr:SpaA isopeptide-forming pilin-related protein [Schaalia suimastitidis]